MQVRGIELHPEAVEGTRAAYDWYRDRNSAAAANFIAEIDRAMEAIAEAPDRWPRYIHNTRRFLLRRFPFSVVFRLAEAALQVVAIVHGRRRPGYWRKR